MISIILGLTLVTFQFGQGCDSSLKSRSDQALTNSSNGSNQGGNNNGTGGPDPEPEPEPEPNPVVDKEWFVAPGGTGTGASEASPLGSIQQALGSAEGGHAVTILPGNYTEALSTVRNGSQGKPILLRSRDGLGSVTITSGNGRVLQVNHSYLTVEGIRFDGEYGDRDTITVRNGGDNFTMKKSEVLRSSRDCMDIANVDDILIDSSLIHHCLNFSGGARADAHGVVGEAVNNLTIKDTEIHTFSGDAIQLDPTRNTDGWDNLLITGCNLWLAPLPAAANGFSAGDVPGENALDTKVGAGRPKIRIEKTTASGFRNGLISNMAAFNLKEEVEVTIDRVLVKDSDIAFRLRGPAHTTIMNTIIHSTSRAIRYEDDVEMVRIWNTTFGGGIGTLLQDASSVSTGVEIKNSLFLTSTLPTEASGDTTNLAVNAGVFANSPGHDYHLKTDSPAKAKGLELAPVLHDYDGKLRPTGLGTYDVGAFLAP